MDKNNQAQPFLIGLVIVLAIVVIYLLATRGTVADQAPTNKEMAETTPTTAETKLDPMKAQIPVDLTEEQTAELKAGSEAHEPRELTFHVTGGSFYFTPNEIRVKQGDKVKIVFTNVLGTHNLVFDEPNIATKTIKDGETDTIEFTADKKGTFEFYCSVGKGYHRMKGQIGVLLVE